MSNPPNGRIVEVRTAFHREAIKPGGVGRNQAMVTAKTAVQKASASIQNRLDDALADLVASLQDQHVSLRNGAPATTLLGCSNDVRDLAGLVDRHLLTETATCLSDALDGVVYENQRLDPAEALVFANALRFSQADNTKGIGAEAFNELLGPLRTLTNHVLARSAPTGA